MRHSLFTILLLFIAASAMAQNDVCEALSLMRSGYIQASVEKLKTSAMKANVEAQFYLAVCYEKGYGVDVNEQEAFRYYRKTAEKGLAVGQAALGECYEKGMGTQSNAYKAAYWKTKSKGKYNNGELSILDDCYAEGCKHPKNYALDPGVTSSRDKTLAQRQNGSNKQNKGRATVKQTPTVTPTITPIKKNDLAEDQKSDVDINIPIARQYNENSFAVVIANENYQDMASVPNALHDGDVFAQYCTTTLGMPATNVHTVKDATWNNIKRELNWLKQVTDAYGGEAKVIFYYAGHGLPDEATSTGYILPIDGFGGDISTGISLKELYNKLGHMQCKHTIVFLDACFSGASRNGGMLVSARGVVIKAKNEVPQGKLVVMSAAQGNETAYPYKEKSHGLFTYYLLKKLQIEKGNVSLGDLSKYIKENVSKKSIVVNGKSQTPCVTPSEKISSDWKDIKLK